MCFKSSHHEIPLLSRVKCLQDAYNNIISNFANQMEEDIHSTILVIKNYDGGGPGAAPGQPGHLRHHQGPLL